MPSSIGNQTSVFTITTTDVYVLEQSDSIFSINSGIINTLAVNTEIIIAGSLFTESFAINVRQAADNSSISILGTGTVQSSSYGVVFGASGGDGADFSILNNLGSISGFGNSGVFVSGVTTHDFFNGGDIFGGTYGVEYSFGAAGGGLVNTGTISGNRGIAVFGGNTKITNLGEIAGIGDIGIEVVGSGFQISNSGTVSGVVTAIDGSEDRDVVLNSGTMQGDVVLNGGDDLYRAGSDGVVLGNVRGGGGDDDLRGADASDELIGGNGNDKLRGRAGEDTLEGGNGRDIIYGGDGDDEITGGNAGDLMLGGAGSDVFVFKDTGDIGTTGATRDEIRDFEQGEDVINLSAMVGPDFIFLGTGNFTGGAAPELRLAEAGGSTFVQLDYDGDGSQDGRMLVRGVVDMTVDDFIL